MLKFLEFFEFSGENSWNLQEFWPNSNLKSSSGSVPRRSNLSTGGREAGQLLGVLPMQEVHDEVNDVRVFGIRCRVIGVRDLPEEIREEHGSLSHQRRRKKTIQSPRALRAKIITASHDLSINIKYSDERDCCGPNIFDKDVWLYTEIQNVKIG